MSIKVMLVDDHQLVRQGLASLLKDQDDLDVVGEAGSASEIMAVAEDTKPDIVVLDIQLPDGSGFDFCRKLQKELDCRVLLLSAFVDRQMVYKAVEARAAGYLLKMEGAAAVIDAVRKIAEGQTVYAPEVNVYLAELINAEGDLTPREMEILALVAEGLTNREIGEKLYISEKTVRNYITRILNKLDLSNRTEAALYWHRSRQGS